MATIHFYEKPGCINNTKQKALLSKAGHVLVVYNLLEQNWAGKPEVLRSFFTDKPVSEWFNPNAPAVKNGEVVPEAVTDEQAIALMIATPILIRRPLLEINGQRCSGFNLEQIQSWLDLAIVDSDQDLETCPSKKSHKQGCVS